MRTASMQNEIKISHAVQKFAFSFGQLDTLKSYKQTLSLFLFYALNTVPIESVRYFWILM